MDYFGQKRVDAAEREKKTKLAIKCLKLSVCYNTRPNFAWLFSTHLNSLQNNTFESQHSNAFQYATQSLEFSIFQLLTYHNLQAV